MSAEAKQTLADRKAIWSAAAKKYEVAMRLGKYRRPDDHQAYQQKDVVELAQLLKKFFNWNNSQWRAARTLLQQSGGKIVLYKEGNVQYVLTEEEFQRIIVPEVPYRFERDSRNAREISCECVARLLVDKWEIADSYYRQGHSSRAEYLFELLLERIDAVAQGAPAVLPSAG